MNLRLVRNRIFTSMLALGFVGATFAMGARSASAQSITVTTPFPFCMNNQAFPTGTYAIHPTVAVDPFNSRCESEEAKSCSPYARKIRDRNSSETGPMWNVGGVTFRNSEGVHTLKAVYDPISDLSACEFKGGVPDHQSRNEHNCATKDYIARSSSAGK